MNLSCPVLEGAVMGTAISLRDDFDAVALRRLARFSKSVNQPRRILALAQIYDGGSRREAAKLVDQPWRIMTIGSNQWARRS